MLGARSTFEEKVNPERGYWPKAGREALGQNGQIWCCDRANHSFLHNLASNLASNLRHISLDERMRPDPRPDIRIKSVVRREFRRTHPAARTPVWALATISPPELLNLLLEG